MDREIIGWVGGLCFAICGIPQVIKCIKEGNAAGLSWVFMILWLFGEIFTFTYVWPKEPKQWPLLANYAFNTTLLLVMFRYKIYPRASIA